MKNTKTKIVNLKPQKGDLLLITIGNEDFPATVEQLRRLADTLKYLNLPCSVLAWNHTLQARLVKKSEWESKVIPGKKDI